MKMDHKQIEVQKSVREESEHIRDMLKDLCDWEKEIKERENSVQGEEQSIKNVPIRSHASKHNLNDQKVINATTETNICQVEGNTVKDSDDSPTFSKKELANISKEKGNSLVKLSLYEDAIYHYNEAIAYFGSDSTFYTNRALCFLRLEKYNECIEDCNIAINLDSKCIKAFYRRMQAYESLGDIDKSLADCNRVLNLDPGNLDAKRSQDRIKKRKNSFNFNLSKSFQSIRDGTKVLEPSWTQIDGYMKEIPVTIKPPHQRSKKPIKRVPVEGIFIDDSHLNEIPNEVIDKLFNCNDCGGFKQVEPKQKVDITPENKKSAQRAHTNTHLDAIGRTDVPKLRKIDKVPGKPNSPVQFYATWKDLEKEQKFLYLKQLESANILKILGAGLEVDTLSEILSIISEYYIRDKCDVSILSEISKHDEISIISMFLSDKDHEALEKIVGYMRQSGYDENLIAHICTKFAVKFK